LPVKVRTLESYLAGLGASGALIAGALVGFVLLVGVVTFDAWPTGSGPFNGSADDVRVDTSLTTTPPVRADLPDLVKLLGGGADQTTAPSSSGGAAGDSLGGLPSGSHELPGEGGPQGGGRQPAQPIRPSQPTQTAGTSSSGQTTSPNVVQQTVSNLGNTLESNTDGLSNSLGGEETALGGVVSSVGSTLNSTLQGLAGN
jgi:hypothetical protein